MNDNETMRTTRKEKTQLVCWGPPNTGKSMFLERRAKEQESFVLGTGPFRGLFTNLTTEEQSHPRVVINAFLPQIDPNTWVIIQEPEQGLHHRYIPEMVEIIQSRFQKFVIETHSPLVLNRFQPNEILLFTGKEPFLASRNTKIVSLVNKGFNMFDALKQLGYELEPDEFSGRKHAAPRIRAKRRPYPNPISRLLQATDVFDRGFCFF